MSLFNFSQEELLTFFAVLVRFSILVSVLPFIGDRFVPAPVKVLFALTTSICLFPVLIRSGAIRPADALIWGSSAYGIASTIASEAFFAFVMGYTARLLFDAIHMGANLAGNFMGFAAASTYDPHQESHTHVVAEIQMTIAMLIFLALDGHHLMLHSALDSYRIVGLGKAAATPAFTQRLIEFTGQVLTFGIQIASPIAVSMFAVNVAFGLMAKAMPQLNILVLSFAVSALVGLFVMFMSVPEFQNVAGNILSKMENWMESMAMSLKT